MAAVFSCIRGHLGRYNLVEGAGYLVGVGSLTLIDLVGNLFRALPARFNSGAYQPANYTKLYGIYVTQATGFEAKCSPAFLAVTLKLLEPKVQ